MVFGLSKLDNKKTGVLAVLAASLMWAFEPILAKLAFRDSDFLETSAVRALVVAAIAMVYLILTRKRTFRIKTGDLPKLLYIALAGTVFADLMYFFALTKIPVINAVLIGHMQPIFIVLLSVLVLRQDRLNRFDYAGIAIMIVAGILVTTKHPENLHDLKFATAGDLYVLLATIAWATAAIAMRKYLLDMNAGTITFFRFTIAAFFLWTFVLAGKSAVVLNHWQVLTGIVVCIGYILYYEGLKRLKAAQVGALELSTPFFAALLAFMVLKEFVSAMQMAAILLLIIGVLLLSRKEQFCSARNS